MAATVFKLKEYETMKTITINEKEIPVYCTVEEADQYFSEKFGGENWAEQTEDNKKRAIITATRKLNQLTYKGFKVDVQQPLQFPRYYKPNYASKRNYTSEANAVRIYGKSYILIEEPEEMVFACCEEAASLLQKNEDSVHIKNQKLGIASTTILGNSVSYTGNGTADTTAVCSEALFHIEKYLMQTARVV